MIKKVFILTSVYILMVNITLSQTVSKKTKEFVHEFLWKKKHFGSLYDNFESTKNAYFVNFLYAKKIKNTIIKIYTFSALVENSKTRILIEKINKNNKSEYAIIGENYGIVEIETLCLFFDKYHFPIYVENKCYNALIYGDIYENYYVPTEFYEDSLFNEYK
jgi:hypothetical protein